MISENNSIIISKIYNVVVRIDLIGPYIRKNSYKPLPQNSAENGIM